MGNKPARPQGPPNPSGLQSSLAFQRPRIFDNQRNIEWDIVLPNKVTQTFSLKEVSPVNETKGERTFEHLVGEEKLSDIVLAVPQQSDAEAHFDTIPAHQIILSRHPYFSTKLQTIKEGRLVLEEFTGHFSHLQTLLRGLYSEKPFGLLFPDGHIENEELKKIIFAPILSFGEHFNTVLANEKFLDFSFVVTNPQNQQVVVKSNRTILTQLPYFRGFFLSGLGHGVDQTQQVITEWRPETVEIALRYLHFGSLFPTFVPGTPEALEILGRIRDKKDVPDKQLAIVVETLCQLVMLGDYFNMYELVQTVVEFLVSSLITEDTIVQLTVFAIEMQSLPPICKGTRMLNACFHFMLKAKLENEVFQDLRKYFDEATVEKNWGLYLQMVSRGIVMKRNRTKKAPTTSFYSFLSILWGSQERWLNPIRDGQMTTMTSHGSYFNFRIQSVLHLFEGKDFYPVVIENRTNPELLSLFQNRERDIQTYLKDTAHLLVFNITDPDSFQYVKEIAEALVKIVTNSSTSTTTTTTTTTTSPTPAGPAEGPVKIVVPLVFVGCGLEAPFPDHRVTANEAVALAQKFNAPYVEVSSVEDPEDVFTTLNLEEAYLLAAREKFQLYGEKLKEKKKK